MLSDLRYALRQLFESRSYIAVAVATLALAGSGCTLVTGYQIADGARRQRSYSTIAGPVHIGRNASINHARTVAGAIHVDDGATTHSLSTIAGAVRVGESVKVEGDVSTVAGDIRIDAGAHVTGKVSSIAGAIGLNGCRVDGPVRITKGSLKTRGATLLPGGIVVRHTNSCDDEHATRIDLGPGAEVASITIEPDAEVNLRISREAHVGNVTGATVTYY